MKRDLLDQIVLAVDKQAKRPPFDGKAWPLALLAIAGAWMIALPLIGLIALLSFIVLQFSTSALYVIGAVMLVGTEVINRRYRRQAFLEAILTPVLIAGLVLCVLPLYLGTFSERSLGCVLMAVLAAILSVVTSIASLRAPLGAIACCGSLSVWSEYYDSPDIALAALHASVGGWLVLFWFQKVFLHKSEVARAAARIEALGNGWIAMACLAIMFSEPSFLVSAILPFKAGSYAGFNADIFSSYKILSTLLSCLAGAWLMWRWPTMRSWRFGLAVLAFALLGSLSAVQGALLLITVVCLSSSKWQLATLAGVGVTWDLGSSYYNTGYSLLWKAAVFAGVGVTLLFCALPRGKLKHVLGSVSGRGQNESADLGIGERRARVYAIFAAGIVALTANALVIQKEYLIAHSESIFIPLAPRDPRSLMSGDYMALRIAVPSDLDVDIYPVRKMIVTREPNGIATFTRRDDGDALNENEFRIDIKYERGTWTLGTDAWYFSEGDAARWERARYGEYRIDKKGRVLLVGLRGSQLEKL